MKKEDINRAIYLVEEIEKSELLLKYIDEMESDYQIIPMHTCPFIVKFNNGLEYKFGDNVNYRMFYNILKSSIEVDLEKHTKDLSEL